MADKKDLLDTDPLQWLLDANQNIVFAEGDITDRELYMTEAEIRKAMKWSKRDFRSRFCAGAFPLPVLYFKKKLYWFKSQLEEYKADVSKQKPNGWWRDHFGQAFPVTTL